MNFPALGISFAQTWLLQPFWEQTRRQMIYHILSFHLFLSVFLSNKYMFLKKIMSSSDIIGIINFSAYSFESSHLHRHIGEKMRETKKKENAFLCCQKVNTGNQKLKADLSCKQQGLRQQEAGDGRESEEALNPSILIWNMSILSSGFTSRTMSSSTAFLVYMKIRIMFT